MEPARDTFLTGLFGTIIGLIGFRLANFGVWQSYFVLVPNPSLLITLLERKELFLLFLLTIHPVLFVMVISGRFGMIKLEF